MYVSINVLNSKHTIINDERIIHNLPFAWCVRMSTLLNNSKQTIINDERIINNLPFAWCVRMSTLLLGSHDRLLESS